MQSKKFLNLLLLIAILLFAVVKAQEEEAVKDDATSAVATPEEPKEDKTDVTVPTEPEKEEPDSTPTHVEEPVAKTTVAPTKPTTVAVKPVPKTTTKAEAPKATNVDKKPVAVTTTKVVAPAAPAPTKAPTTTISSSKVDNNNSSSANKNSGNTTTTSNAAVSGSGNTSNAAANNAGNTPNGNAIAPSLNANTFNQNTNTQQQQSPITSTTTDGTTVQPEQDGESNGVVTKVVLGLVGVCAVVGVATVGVRAYSKKNSGDDDEIHMISAMEAQDDFKQGPESYNAYNIMNNVPNEPYVAGSPYEAKPYQEPYQEAYQHEAYQDNMTTTPFERTETAQADNYMSRDSIFSTSGNIPQIGNDVFNFQDNDKLPYVQDYDDMAYGTTNDEPISREIQEENYSLPRSQMPTLVPVQPEITVTAPTEEPANEEGYKQIVPTVAQMEIIETPDYNNMTPSMIEDHINNMDLEQLANTEENEDTEGGYKQIVPDIQEAVIENFPDIEEEDEEDEMNSSAVDNITDTYRAALRATYCSVTDENRFSYRTIDSDHSLLHTMRQDGEW